MSQDLPTFPYPTPQHPPRLMQPGSLPSLIPLTHARTGKRSHSPCRCLHPERGAAFLQQPPARMHPGRPARRCLHPGVPHHPDGQAPSWSPGRLETARYLLRGVRCRREGQVFSARTLLPRLDTRAPLAGEPRFERALLPAPVERSPPPPSGRSRQMITFRVRAGVRPQSRTLLRVSCCTFRQASLETVCVFTRCTPLPT